MHRLQLPSALEWLDIQRAQATRIDELRHYRFGLCIVTRDAHVERMTRNLARDERSGKVRAERVDDLRASGRCFCDLFSG